MGWENFSRALLPVINVFACDLFDATAPYDVRVGSKKAIVGQLPHFF